MTTERAQVGHQTRYSVRVNGVLTCTLTYGEPDSAMSIWKILKPSTHGSDDCYGTERFLAPDATQLQTWLAPVVGNEHAAELAQAAESEPPRTAAWQRPDPDGTGQG